jgi:hypothetical protein
MKRAEAIRQIAAILDQVESNGQIVQSLTIRRTTIQKGFLKTREGFAKRVDLTIVDTMEGEFSVIDPAR